MFLLSITEREREDVERARTVLPAGVHRVQPRERRAAGVVVDRRDGGEVHVGAVNEQAACDGEECKAPQERAFPARDPNSRGGRMCQQRGELR